MRACGARTRTHARSLVARVPSVGLKLTHAPGAHAGSRRATREGRDRAAGLAATTEKKKGTSSTRRASIFLIQYVTAYEEEMWLIPRTLIQLRKPFEKIASVLGKLIKVPYCINWENMLRVFA